MTTDLRETRETSGALALTADQHQWTEEQRAALAQLGVDRASTGDLAVFLHVAQRTGLDPFSRQLYLIGRSGKWTIQTGIDGFRVIADRRPEYRGQIGPQWCGEDGVWRDFWPGGKPVAARVGVVRSDWDQPAWGVALYAEFAVANNHMWKDKPAHMLAKCAESLAIRKAFPHDLAGLVTDDEMGRADRQESSGGRGVVDHGPRVTADELTGRSTAPEPPVGVRDWDADIAALTQAKDLEGLKHLYHQAKGHDEVRARITAAGEQVKAAGPTYDVQDAELVDPDVPGTVSTEQHAHMHALWAKGEITDRDERLTITALLIGHPISSSSEMTAAEADMIIRRLREHDRGTGALYKQMSRWLDEATAAAEDGQAAAESSGGGS